MDIKIKSPKTKRLINVNGDAYQKLITVDHYIEADLLKLIDDPTLKIYPSVIKMPIQPDPIPKDIKYEIINQSDFYTLIKLYKTNQAFRALLNDQTVLNNLIIKFKLTNIINTLKRQQRKVF